tara:strand:+ start:8233 stop:8721 length:489 start_codon:yes stop_codon:yes gene_type:complete
MKVYQFVSLILLLVSPSLLIAQPIQDISSDDPHHNIIKHAVNNGYLSLYNDNSFKPNTPLSRRDAVMIIHELDKKLTNNAIHLKANDFQELTALSKSFKQLYNSTNNSLISVQNDNKMLRHEHKLLLHQITSLQQSQNKYQKERKLLFGLIALSTLIGFLYP